MQLIRFSARDIGVDLGTKYILMTVKGDGIILREPSIIGVDKKTSVIVATGNDANDAFEKSPETIKIIRPLKDGVIADYTATGKLISDMMAKVKNKYSVNKPRIVVGIPCGITDVEKRAVINVFLQAGAKEVYVVYEPLAAAIGAGMNVLRPVGRLVVDIGAGTTEVSSISMGTILSNVSIKTGGNVIDDSIVEYLKSRKGIAISNSIAEDLKKNIGCATPFLTELTQEIRARNISTGNPEKFTISSKDIEAAMERPMRDILNAIEKTLANTSSTIVSDIIENGIVLTGGGAQIKNLDNFIAQYFKIKTIIAPDSADCVVKGTGKILENIERYRVIFERDN